MTGANVPLHIPVKSLEDEIHVSTLMSESSVQTPNKSAANSSTYSKKHVFSEFAMSSWR